MPAVRRSIGAPADRARPSIQGCGLVRERLRIEGRLVVFGRDLVSFGGEQACSGDESPGRRYVEHAGRSACCRAREQAGRDEKLILGCGQHSAPGDNGCERRRIMEALGPRSSA